MTTFILIIMMHVGMAGSGKSNSLTSIGGFQTIRSCIDAGELAVKMTVSSTDEIKYICVPNK